MGVRCPQTSEVSKTSEVFDEDLLGCRRPAGAASVARVLDVLSRVVVTVVVLQ